MSQQADLVSRLDTEALVAEIVDDLVERLAGYGRLEGGERAEVEAAVRYAVEMVLATVRDGRRPTAAELAPIGEAAAQRAAQGVPLEEVLHAYRVGPRIAWTHLLALAEAGEDHALAEMALHVMDYVDRAAIVVTRGYLDERDRIAAAENRLYRRLLRALCLEENRSSELDVLAVRLDLIDVDQLIPFAAALRASGPAAQVGHAARLRERGVLAVSEDDHVRGVVPSQHRADLADEGWLTVVGVASAASRLADALDDAAVGAIGGAATGRRGQANVSELAIEAMLLRSRTLSRQLADDVLQPLETNDKRRRGGALVETLETYLSSGADRAEAAARLHVHVNTLDLRLRRIRDLSGVDLSHPADIARIVLALRHRSIEPEP